MQNYSTTTQSMIGIKTNKPKARMVRHSDSSYFFSTDKRMCCCKRRKSHRATNKEEPSLNARGKL